MSRIDALYIALLKAHGREKGAVLASDAFFPFSDVVEEAGKMELPLLFSLVALLEMKIPSRPAINWESVWFLPGFAISGINIPGG